MTQRRELNLEVVKQYRAAGKAWQEIAVALGWNISALRDRLRREGFFDNGEQAATEMAMAAGVATAPEIDEKDGVKIDWKQVTDLLKTGNSVADTAAFFGINPQYLKNRYDSYEKRRFSDFSHFFTFCRALGRCEVRQSLFNLVKSGDKNALTFAKQWLDFND